MYLLRCPGCHQTMRYAPINRSAKTRRKRCVYCGRSFDVKSNVVKKES